MPEAPRVSFFFSFLVVLVGYTKNIHEIFYRHRDVILEILSLSDVGRRQKQKKKNNQKIK